MSGVRTSSSSGTPSLAASSPTVIGRAYARGGPSRKSGPGPHRTFRPSFRERAPVGGADRGPSSWGGRLLRADRANRRPPKRRRPGRRSGRGGRRPRGPCGACAVHWPSRPARSGRLRAGAPARRGSAAAVRRTPASPAHAPDARPQPRDPRTHAPPTSPRPPPPNPRKPPPAVARRPRTRLCVSSAHVGVTSGSASLVGIGDRGLGLVVCSSHSSVGVRGEHLDLLAGFTFDDLDAITRATGTALALARTAGAHTRVSQQVLGTVGTTLGRCHRTLELGDATLHGTQALRGLQQRLVDAAGSLRRALVHGGTRDPGRATARTGAVRLQAGSTHGGVERPARTGAWRHWSRASSRRGTARCAIPGRASEPARGSSQQSTEARRNGRSTRGSSR